ncbi:MAG: hypothetical protein ABRQ27_06805 [Clostridiaceae bacterium]
MEVRGNIGLSDYSNIYDYIGVVGTRDNISIALNTVNQENIYIICSMLIDSNFSIYEQGWDVHGNYYINAVKRN